MSTHNIQFHDINKKISLNICFLELLEEFHRVSKTSLNHPGWTSHLCSSHCGSTIYRKMTIYPHFIIQSLCFSLDTTHLASILKPCYS